MVLLKFIYILKIPTKQFIKCEQIGGLKQFLCFLAFVLCPLQFPTTGSKTQVLADFTDWMSIQPSNFLEEIIPNLCNSWKDKQIVRYKCFNIACSYFEDLKTLN